MPRPRILITGPAPPPPGGIAAVIRTIVESELAERFEFARLDTTVQRRALDSAWLHYANAALSRGLGFDGVWNLEASAKLAAYRAALEPRPDLVHLHTSHGYDFWLGVRMARIARRRGLPSLLHVHGLFDIIVPTWPPIRRACFGPALRVPDRVIVLSEGWQRWFAQHVDAARLRVLRNPVDARRFRGPKPAPPAAGEPLRLLFVGTNEPVRKGGYEILDAAPAVLAAEPGVRFVFVGEDTEDLFAKRVRGTPLEPHFDFVGSKDAVAIAPYFDAADALLLPSHSEGLPIALLEGMAAGLPVIACPVNGIPEAMQDPENGYFVPPRTPRALADAIVRLVRDPAARARMAEANRRRAVADFDQPIFARALGAIYDETLTGA
jgi:glycosyltransferase involved in cell wall biosynthesis